MAAKVLNFSGDARQRLLQGVTVLASAVKVTRNSLKKLRLKQQMLLAMVQQRQRY